jgi:hypothetical protein
MPIHPSHTDDRQESSSNSLSLGLAIQMIENLILTKASHVALIY